ncbi:hypothetical protein QJQ45_016616 [Haematococcus lacustris]|nr:hypothetical protein QJQ45_016616 [Haematococcus lacustris]
MALLHAGQKLVAGVEAEVEGVVTDEVAGLAAGEQQAGQQAGAQAGGEGWVEEGEGKEEEEEEEEEGEVERHFGVNGEGCASDRRMCNFYSFAAKAVPGSNPNHLGAHLLTVACPYLSSAEARAGATNVQVVQRVLEDVVSMFDSFPFEYDYWIHPSWVSGTIPPELKGTYLRNGPGMQVGRERYQRHFMDGDGCVLALMFPGQGAAPHFSNRYVRTPGFVQEQAAKQPLFRNAFTRGAADGSSWFNPLDLSFKNVANTGVLYWGGKLWALWEVGAPFELDPHTLATLGASDMGGQIGPRLAGHYRLVQEPDGSQRCVTFGLKVSFAGMQLAIYELDSTGAVVAQSEHSLPGLLDIMFVHDILVTPHWYLIIMGPVQVDGGAGGQAEALGATGIRAGRLAAWGGAGEACRLFITYAPWIDALSFLTKYVVGKLSLAELLRYDTKAPSKVICFPRPGKPLAPNTAAVSPMHPSSTCPSPATSPASQSGAAAPASPDPTHTASCAASCTAATPAATVSVQPPAASSVISRESLPRPDSAAPPGAAAATTATARAAAPVEAAEKLSVPRLMSAAAKAMQQVVGAAAQRVASGLRAVLPSFPSSSAAAKADGLAPEGASPSSSPMTGSSASPSSRGGGKVSAADVVRGGAITLAAPPFFTFHHVNAYEVEGSGGAQVVMDTVSWQDIAFSTTQYNVTKAHYQDGCRTHLYRMVLDLPQRRLHSCQRLLRRTLEFPAINQGQATAQPYRHAYFAADAVDHGRAWGPAQVLLKASLPLVTSTDLTAVQQPAVEGVEGAGRGGNKGSRQQEPAAAGVEDAAGVVTESWAPGPHCFVQEPFFVPRPGGASEDDGWIIVGVHNAETRRGEVSILDAQCIGKGPLATLHLPHPLPMGLHGTWTSELLGRHPPPLPATDPGTPAAVPEPVTRLHQM